MIIERDDEAFLAILAHHHGFKGVNIRAAGRLPARFAFRQGANVAPAFGHDAAGMGEIPMLIPRADFQGDGDCAPAV